MIGEPVDAEVDAMRLDFRQSLAAELEGRMRPRSPAGICPIRMRAWPRRAIVGALMEGLLGPLAPI